MEFFVKRDQVSTPSFVMIAKKFMVSVRAASWKVVGRERSPSRNTSPASTVNGEFVRVVEQKKAESN